MENKKYKCGICGKTYGSIEERSACEVKCLKAAEEEKKRKAAAAKNERKKKLEKEISELKLKLTMLESELKKEYEGETNDEVFDLILNDFFSIFPWFDD